MWEWCCGCLDGPERREANERTSLMHGASYSRRQQPGGGSGPTGAESRPSTGPGPLPYSIAQGAATSHATSESKREASASGIPRLVIKPVQVSSVDKRFQDHADLFNKYVDQWEELNKIFNDLSNFDSERDLNDSLEVAIMRAADSVDGAQSGSIEDAFRRIKRRLDKCPSSVTLSEPSPQCVQLAYEPRDVTHDVIPALRLFNAAGCLARDLLARGPTLRTALQLVLDSAPDLRREIILARLGGGVEGKEAGLRACADNEGAVGRAMLSVGGIERGAKERLGQLRNCGICPRV